MAKGLVLVDIQNDYFKGGKYELVSPEQAAEQASRMMAFFRQRQWPILHVRHISQSPDATFFLPESTGAEIYAGCLPLEGEAIIIKHQPDSFHRTSLKEKLAEQEVKELVVCGMMTHMCIDTTVRAAAALGYEIDLIADACATRDLTWEGMMIPAEQVQGAYLAAMSGTFATVYRAEAWINRI